MTTMNNTMQMVLVAAAAVLVSMTVQAADESQADESQQVGNFTVKNSVDEFGKVQASAQTVGEHATMLMWVCTPGREPGVQVGWYWGRFLMGDRGRIRTTYRFGDGTASEVMWQLGGSHKGVFAEDGGLFTTYARVSQRTDRKPSRELSTPSDTLLIRVTDRDGHSVTEKFTLTGLELALAHLPCSEAAGLPNAFRDKLLRESQKVDAPAPVAGTSAFWKGANEK